MVPIDTMGMSQKDKLVPELTGMLAGCQVQHHFFFLRPPRRYPLDDVVRATRAKRWPAVS